MRSVHTAVQERTPAQEKPGDVAHCIKAMVGGSLHICVPSLQPSLLFIHHQLFPEVPCARLQDHRYGWRQNGLQRYKPL